MIRRNIDWSINAEKLAYEGRVMTQLAKRLDGEGHMDARDHLRELQERLTHSQLIVSLMLETVSAEVPND